MPSLFNADFIEFLELLDKNKVQFLLIGGYAVILHGYVRSTSDMDIFVERTVANYENLKKTYTDFGAPIFSKDEFLDANFDVWSIGREPSKIDIVSQIKGITFEESIGSSEWFDIENIKIPYIHINHLVRNKLATGRNKDIADVEQLSKLLNIK